MANITFPLPPNWNRPNCQNIDEARVAKRCRDLVGDVTGALEVYSDTLVARDNDINDFCPDPNHVIALRIADRYGDSTSDVDLSYSSDKRSLVRGEVRSSGGGFTAISKAEPCSDGTTIFSRTIEYADSNGTRNEQDLSVRMNPDGTLSILSDVGDFPANCIYGVRSVHAKSAG